MGRATWESLPAAVRPLPGRRQRRADPAARLAAPGAGSSPGRSTRRSRPRRRRLGDRRGQRLRAGAAARRPGRGHRARRRRRGRHLWRPRARARVAGDRPGAGATGWLVVPSGLATGAVTSRPVTAPAGRTMRESRRCPTPSGWRRASRAATTCRARRACARARLRAGADRDGHPVPRRRVARPRRAPSAWPPTWSTAGTTAWWSAGPPGSRRRPRDAEKERLLRGRRRGGGRPGQGGGRGRHQRHPPHVELSRAAEKAGAHGAAARHAVLQQAAAGGAGRALPDRGRRHRPAGDALRHPRPHRHADRVPSRWSGWPRTSGSSRSRTPRATCSTGSRVMARDRPGLLLRRRRAEPGLAHPRRASASSAWSAHVRGADVRRDGRRRRRRRPADARSRIHRRLLPVGHARSWTGPRRARSRPRPRCTLPA